MTSHLAPSTHKETCSFSYFCFFFSFLFLFFLTLISSFWIVILPFFVQFFCSILFMFDVVTIWSTWWAVVYSLMRILRVPSETGSVLFDINDDFFPFHDCYCVSLFFFKKMPEFLSSVWVCVSVCLQVSACAIATNLFFCRFGSVSPSLRLARYARRFANASHCTGQEIRFVCSTIFFFNYKNKKQLIVECQLGCIIFHCVGIPVL